MSSVVAVTILRENTSPRCTATSAFSCSSGTTRLPAIFTSEMR